MTDTIELTGLEVDCIVGLYPHERKRAQRVHVDLALELDTRRATTEGIDHTVDYARLAGEIRFLLEHARFHLLETAAEALAAYILAPATKDAPHAPVDRAKVRLAKPGVVEGATPTVTVERGRADFEVEVETKPFGKVDVIYERAMCGIYRLRIAPGAAIPTHVHRRMNESELVLGDGLHLQGKVVEPGTGYAWPHDHPHRYDNPTDTEQTVLCVDLPRFEADDEIEVIVDVADLAWPAVKAYYPEAARQTRS
jgi:dihydroneopterin aldolase